MRNHSRCLSFLLSGILSVSLLAPLSSAQAAYDGSIRNLVDRVTVLTESVQTESANEEELAKLDEMQAELEDKADAKEDVSETETVSMVVTGGTINVRTGPGTNYDKITQVVSGKQVTVVGESNGWYQVTFDSTTGWLLGEYLRDPADLDGPRARHRTRTLRQRFGRDRVFPIPLRRDRFAADRSGRYLVADRSADRML